jgi:riboflavin kinase
VFDAIFFNACFGNIWDQYRALEQTQKFLTPGGRILISHPLGTKFVNALHDSMPDLVPHSLPTRDRLSEWLKTLPLRLEQFDDRTDFYLVVLQNNE